MKRFLLLPAILGSMILLGFSSVGDWVRYVSKEGHYSIEFPGAPAENAADDSNGSGRPVTIHYASYFPNDSEGYMIDWVDMRNIYPAKKSIKQILENSRDGAVRSIKATYVTTSAIYLGKEPYIDFAFTNKQFAGKGRIYVINKFQYTLLTLFSLNAGISADADKFISSFKQL